VKLFFLCLLGLLLGLSASPVYSRCVQARLTAALAQDYEIRLKWDQALTSPSAAVDFSLASFLVSPDPHFFGNDLQVEKQLQLPLHLERQSEKSLVSVLKDLLRLRQKLRDQVNTEQARRLIWTLDNLVEETLFVLAERYPGSSSVVHIDYLPNPKVEPLDIILSQSESLSSLLLNFRSDYSNHFSHVDLALLDENQIVRSYSVDLPGFVHNPQLVDPSWVRSLQLRLKTDQRRSEKEVLVQTFAHKLESWDAIQFNMSLNPQCTDNHYFCTEFLFCQYQMNAPSLAWNPFPRELWNPEVRGSFFSQFTGPIPEPSDLLVNRSYEFVAEDLNVRLAARARLENFVLQVFIHKVQFDWRLQRKLQQLLANPKMQTAEATQDASEFFIQGTQQRVHLPLAPQDFQAREYLTLYAKIATFVHPQMLELFARIERQLDPQSFNLLLLVPTVDQVIDEQFELTQFP